MDSELLIQDLKLSSVVPARKTAEDARLELGNMDMVMKLHYIKTVHFFDKEAVEGLTIQDFKNPMFDWLSVCYPICGRIRRPGDKTAAGRPFVRCNDSGVRIVEASCGTKTVDEWIATVDSGDSHRLLVYHQPLAHDLGFIPLVFLQFTKFKCGGLSVGMSWAHILGDAFSALSCINMWGKIMAKHTTPPPPFSDNAVVTTRRRQVAMSTLPRSIKLLDPLGDNWLTPNRCKMQMHTFHLADVNQLMSNLLLTGDPKNYNEAEPFDVISAIIWKSLARIRGINTNDNVEPKIVTVCKKGEGNGMLGNTHQVIGTVEAHESVKDADVLELAKLIAQKQLVDETGMIDSLVMENENSGVDDFVVYGANLTFVKLEEVDLYGLQLKGQQPVFADLSIGGVGDAGVVVVLPLGRGHECGRIVNVILPEDQVRGLKNEIGEDWGNV